MDRPSAPRLALAAATSLRGRPAAAGALLFLFALALRLAYLWEWHDTPFFRVPIGDGLRYHLWAQEIARGDWFGREVFYQAPLYPYFLASLYSVFGDGPWVARVAQAVLGAAACVLLWRFGRRAFSPAVGALCGIGLALYPPDIFNAGILQKTALATTLLAASLYLHARLAGPPPARAPLATSVLLGAALAMLALAQEHLLLLAPLMALFLVFRRATDGGGRLLPIAGMALGLAIVFVPIGLRNQAIGGSFLITTAQFGPNFYLGNNPAADGHYRALREGRGDAQFERQDAEEIAAQALGRRLTPSEVSQYWLGRSLDFIRQQPAQWLALSLHKWHLVWHRRELPDTDSLDAYADQSRLLSTLLPIWNFGVLAPLGAAGLLLGGRRPGAGAWLAAALLAVSLGVAAFIVYGRYRYPLALMLMPFAAHALVESVAWLRRWQRRGDRIVLPGGSGAIAAALAVALVTAIVVHWPMPPRDLRAINYYGVAARILQQQGSLADAERLLRKTIALVPEQAYPYFALSVVYKRTGRHAAEAELLRKALSLAPQVSAGYAALAEAERRAQEQAAGRRAD